MAAQTEISTAYGFWPLVLISSTIFIVFALSFTHPKTGRDWRSMGAFSAFLVALFTEMYIRLARREERAIGPEFAQSYGEYAARVPAFLPHLPRTWPRKWRRSGGEEAAGRGLTSTTRMPTGGEGE